LIPSKTLKKLDNACETNGRKFNELLMILVADKGRGRNEYDWILVDGMR
jgi:hypothetical protein